MNLVLLGILIVRLIGTIAFAYTKPSREDQPYQNAWKEYLKEREKRMGMKK